MTRRRKSHRTATRNAPKFPAPKYQHSFNSTKPDAVATITGTNAPGNSDENRYPPAEVGTRLRFFAPATRCKAPPFAIIQWVNVLIRPPVSVLTYRILGSPLTHKLGWREHRSTRQKTEDKWLGRKRSAGYTQRTSYVVYPSVNQIRAQNHLNNRIIVMLADIRRQAKSRGLKELWP
jgi:hypothetical protein